ncbi:hypothetical protein SAMN05216354_2485 [Xylanibacter ruminicola]|jgi:hypothetical protein|uniref:Uncharacterized protein n=1 Tax=Xylanibacter ruminicola TaxID=839 RepID=A0A1H5WTS4_XYLRU|nr:hypothetical protein SAMN05216354_2485 [Xylanibacter ruminicola]
MAEIEFVFANSDTILLRKHFGHIGATKMPYKLIPIGT